MDHTGSAWVSMFNDQSAAILGVSAADMMQLKESNESRFTDQLQSINFKRYTFKLKAKLESYNDEQQVKLTASNVSHFDYGQECHKLVDIINSY